MAHDATKILEAEQAVIGCTIMNVKNQRLAQGMLKPEWFYSERHRKFYEAIILLGPDSDLVSVAHTCQLDEAGKNYLMTIMDNFDYMGASLRWHCDIIREAYQRRMIQAAGSDAIQKASKATEDVTGISKELEGRIQDALACAGDTLEENKSLYYRMMDRIYSGPSTVTGLSIGYDIPDEAGYQIEAGTSFVIAAESGIGKSAFALTIADHWDRMQDGAGLYFTLESTRDALAMRRIANRSGIPLSALKSGNIWQTREAELHEAVDGLRDSKLQIVDDGQYRIIEDLEAMAESYALKHKLAYVVIDFIQQMYTRRKTGSRHLDMSYISDRLNGLAKSLNIPVVYLSQLRKDIDGRPTLDDLKESGDIRNNSDNICLMWSPDKVKNYSEKKYEYHVECFMAKVKDQQPWGMWLKWMGGLMRFQPAKKKRCGI